MKGGYRVPMALLNPMHYLAAGIKMVKNTFVPNKDPSVVLDKETGRKLARPRYTTPNKLKGKRYTLNQRKRRRSRLRKAKAKARHKRLRKVA